jgi:hypothetical protein
MAIRSRTAVAGLVAATVLTLVAQAGCGVGHATRSDASPAASTPATTGTTPTGTASASPDGTAPAGGPGTSTPRQGSGLTGVTVVDGGCPVVRLDSPCPERPIQARLTVTDTSSGALAGTADSDQAGHFQIPLAPGQYVVHPTNPNGASLPRAVPVTATVRPGQYTTLTIRFDSGIR